MGKAEDKDLRKEVEMTEHTDSIEKVCQQYQTCGEKGLTDSAVEDVSSKDSILAVLTSPFRRRQLALKSIISIALNKPFYRDVIMYGDNKLWLIYLAPETRRF